MLYSLMVHYFVTKYSNQVLPNMETWLNSIQTIGNLFHIEIVCVALVIAISICYCSCSKFQSLLVSYDCIKLIFERAHLSIL